MKGSRVCRSHGGAAKQVKAKAAERTAEQDARKAFGKLSDHAVPVDDPFAEFAKLAGEAVAWKDWAAGRIADLERIDSTDAKGTEQVRAQVALFERAMDRCAGFLRDFAKLGIEDRMSRVTVAQRVAIVRAIESVMAHLGWLARNGRWWTRSWRESCRRDVDDDERRGRCCGGDRASSAARTG